MNLAGPSHDLTSGIILVSCPFWFEDEKNRTKHQVRY